MNFADYGKSKLPVIMSELDRRFPSSITVSFNRVTADILLHSIIRTAALHRNNAAERTIVEIIKGNLCGFGKIHFIDNIAIGKTVAGADGGVCAPRKCSRYFARNY